MQFRSEQWSGSAWGNVITNLFSFTFEVSKYNIGSYLQLYNNFLKVHRENNNFSLTLKIKKPLLHSMFECI